MARSNTRLEMTMRMIILCLLQAIMPWTALLHASDELTPAQQRILQAPARNFSDRKFSFDDAPGPQFSDEQKQAQREAGKAIAAIGRASASDATTGDRLLFYARDTGAPDPHRDHQ
ncbi:MAG: hypothetical protein NTX50_22405 [Candidatus Sumerlaeota bacterium]|nr:hypothetical protein [Candidatus Sumerlaeota bacterium]